MTKKFLLIFILHSSLFLQGQQTILPMKGKYIFIEFREKTNNTKRPILDYFSVANEGKGNSLYQNCLPKYMEFYKFSWNTNIFSSKLKSDFTRIMASHCFLDNNGEIHLPGYMQIMLSPQSNFLDNSGLGLLLNMSKKKIISHHINADMILEVHSNNEYSLIITNFKYFTQYIKGSFSGESGSNVINVEELINVVNDKENKYRKTEKETAQKYIEFIEKLTKGIAKVFQEELKRMYEIDELY
jgi:hypothetical protein